MAKATVTVIRSARLEKATGLGAGKIVEALVHIPASNYTIHAEDVGLRRMTRFYLQPLDVHWLAAGSIINTKAFNNLASITIASIRYVPDTGTVVVAGTAQDYYGIFIGE